MGGFYPPIEGNLFWLKFKISRQPRTPFSLTFKRNVLNDFHHCPHQLRWEVLLALLQPLIISQSLTPLFSWACSHMPPHCSGCPFPCHTSRASDTYQSPRFKGCAGHHSVHGGTFGKSIQEGAPVMQRSPKSISSRPSIFNHPDLLVLPSNDSAERWLCPVRGLRPKPLCLPFMVDFKRNLHTPVRAAQSQLSSMACVLCRQRERPSKVRCWNCFAHVTVWA